MYLKGSKWSMNKRRRRSNPWLIAFLVLAIGFFAYINAFVLPNVQPPFVPTPTPTRDPISYSQEAETALAEGRIGEAMSLYESAIDADPQEISNYLSLAKLQIYRGDYEAARENAEYAVLLDKTRPYSFALLAWSKGYLDDYLEAETDVKSALELDPNDAFAHAVYAFILARQVVNNVGELDTLDNAIENSREALRLNPNLLEARWARGYVLEITSNYEEAVQQLEAAIEIDDSIGDLHLALGRNLFTLEEYDQAVFEFTKAYSLNPGDSTPNWYISQVYARIGEFAKAIQYAEQAVNDEPGDPYLHANLGTMYYRDLRYNQAIEQLELAVRGGTTGDGTVVEGIPLDYAMTVIEIYSRYGLSLARVNRCSEAVQVATAMLQTVPDDETAVYNAEEMIRICQDFQDNPPTPTPTLEGDGEDTGVDLTPTP
jgi:tetratricopeptide (TPR) repeat protein